MIAAGSLIISVAGMRGIQNFVDSSGRLSTRSRITSAELFGGNSRRLDKQTDNQVASHGTPQQLPTWRLCNSAQITTKQATLDASIQISVE
jgi:hypothetical protein